MASSTGWKLLAAIGALMLATACGDDSSSNNNDQGDGDGDGDSTPPPAKPLLEPNVAGNMCSIDGDCGPTGKCAKQLTGGMLPMLLGGFIGQGIDLSMPTPGNYCTATCKSDADCNTGGACFGILPSTLSGFLGGGGGGLTGALSGECRKKCEANTDCRDGYECAMIKDGALNGIPGIGMFAGLITGGIPKTCQPKPMVTPITDAVVGKACSEDAECAPGNCTGASEGTDGGAPVQGSCSATCAADTDCGSSEGICAGVIYGSGGQCAEKCATTADCKHAGYTCQTLLGTKACAPDMNPVTPAGDAGAGDAGAHDGGV
ncbi:MAG: hypothetical protein QM778_33085 [Myxococcales bacterium]